MEHKIYSDDPLIKYTSTEVPPSRTKHQIDGVLAEYEVIDVYWHGVPKNWDDVKDNQIYVVFKIEETVNNMPVLAQVRVDCPTIWDREKPKGRPPKPEMVNWAVSMRAMHWFIYTHLNAAYAMHSSKTVAFLGYIQGSGNQLLKDLILPRLTEYTAIEDKSEPVEPRKVINVTPRDAGEPTK